MGGMGIGIGLGLSSYRPAAAPAVPALPFTNGANTEITDVGDGWYRITKTGGVDGETDAWAYATEGFVGGYTCRFRWPNVNPDEELALWVQTTPVPVINPASNKAAIVSGCLSYGGGAWEGTPDSGNTAGFEPGDELVFLSGTGAMANISINGTTVLGTDSHDPGPARPGAAIKTFGAFIEIKLS